MVDPIHRREHHIAGSPEEVWHAFLNEENLEKWLRANSTEGMEPREEHDFTWHVSGERVVGKVKHLEVYRRIIFEWRFEGVPDRWPEGHYAVVDLRLSPQSGGERTFILLEVTNIPNTERDEVRSFWSDLVMSRLDDYLEDDPELERAA